MARAGADPRVRANLALAVGLQGRLAEAENIVKADLPADGGGGECRAAEAPVVAQGQGERARPRAEKMPIAAAAASN